MYQHCIYSSAIFLSYIVLHFDLYGGGLDYRVREFNATSNNISVISWRSVLLVEETGVLSENHRTATNH